MNLQLLLTRVLRTAMLGAFALALGFAVLSMPTEQPALAAAINESLDQSGVKNPVTAVLLNFRGYDTLLEIGVLSLSLTAVWSLGFMPRRRLGKPSLVLSVLVQILLPFLILLSAYLLWAGAAHPGGAFQGGAVLAAACLLFILADFKASSALADWPLRLGLMAGLGTFIGVGFAMFIGGRHFLEYPPADAKTLMLIIEAAAMVSIALILAGLFRGGRPRIEPHNGVRSHEPS